MGDWTESKYTETRFGGMDKSVEPHTLDRDGGIMADEFNMQSRTQGLRTRKGWRPANDLTLYVSSLPGTPKSPLALISFISNLATVAEDDDDDDSGGDGGNGGVIGGLTDGDDDDSVTPGGHGSSVTLSLTGPQAVVAEVPFTIGAGANNAYSGGTARLEWGFQPDGEPSVSLTKGIRSGWDDNAWQAQATIWTADRTRTGVKMTLKKGNTVAATKNMGYSVASMIPDLPESITYRQPFSFSVSCKLGGAVQTRYAGSGRGVALRWEALDSNDQVVSCHVVVTNETWANGVGTFTGRLSSVAPTAEKLRLTVAYAGEKQTDDSSIIGAGTMVAPSALHVFSGGGTLRINAVALNPSELTLAAYSGDTVVDLSDYLEMAEDGTPVGISTGWDGNVWEHTVQAKTSAPGRTLTLQLMRGQEELATANINIVDAITATIATSPSPIYEGDDLTATATISATGYTITRIPAEKVQIVISGETDESALNDENQTEVEATYEDVPAGSIVVQVKDMRDETILASVTIDTTSYQTRLVEAINERLTVKGYSVNSLVDDDETDKSVLYAKGNEAMSGFVDGDVAADGTYTSFGNSELPAYADTDDSWYQDAYETVIQAVARSVNTTSMYPTREYKRKVGDQQSADTASAAAAAAIASCNGKAWDDYWYFDTDGVVTEMTTSTSGDTHYAKAILKYTGTDCTFREKVSCTIDIYGQGNSYFSGTWDTMGHQHVVADKNTTEKIATITVPANEDVTIRLGGTLADAIAQYGGTQNTGYQQYSHSVNIAKYNFTHK